MPNPKNKLDLTGQRFGKLIAQKISFSNSKYTVWECLCDCGKTAFARVGNLRSGNSTSCGCNRPQCTLESTIKRVLCMRRHSAIKRGLTWSISTELGTALLKSNCYYCDTPPFHEMTSYARDIGHLYGGIDRIDSSLGYEDGNVRPCCINCNLAKSDMTDNQFREWCQKVASFQWWNK